jgi:hypothetical protein
MQSCRSCSIIDSLHYNSSLNTWTVVRLTATKFKPLKISMPGFALPYIPHFPKSKSKLLYDWQSVCLGIKYPCGTRDQILFPVGMLPSEICGLVSIGRPLWREYGSEIYGVIIHWSESLRTRNHILLSHLRLPQLGGPGSRIYIPQEQGGPVIPPGAGFPLSRLLRLAGLLNWIELNLFAFRKSCTGLSP